MNLLLTATLLLPLQGRLAISHDGNDHDQDDWGSVAMMEALLWRAGAQDALVHLDYNSHRGASVPSWEAEMRTSATRFADRFGLDSATLLDTSESVRRSVASLAAQIDASTDQDRLTILQEGPWQVTALAFMSAHPARHQYVTIVSHSDWNDEHEHLGAHWTRDELLALYAPGGALAAFDPPTYVRIDDQNDYAFKSTLGEWTWMLGAGAEMEFVFSRTATATWEAEGDMSGAGMLFWLLTGIEHPTMDDVRTFFGL